MVVVVDPEAAVLVAQESPGRAFGGSAAGSTAERLPHEWGLRQRRRHGQRAYNITFATQCALVRIRPPLVLE